MYNFYDTGRNDARKNVAHIVAVTNPATIMAFIMGQSQVFHVQ